MKVVNVRIVVEDDVSERDLLREVGQVDGAMGAVVLVQTPLGEKYIADVVRAKTYVPLGEESDDVLVMLNKGR